MGLSGPSTKLKEFFLDELDSAYPQTLYVHITTRIAHVVHTKKTAHVDHMKVITAEKPQEICMLKAIRCEPATPQIWGSGRRLRP